MNTHCEPELLSQAIDGELDAKARQMVDEHLASCGMCRGEIDRLLALGERLRASAPPVDAVRARRALREILGAPRPSSSAPFGLRLAPAAAVLVCVVVLAVVLVVVRRSTSPTVPSRSASSDLTRFDGGNRVEIYVARHGREVR